MVPMNLPTARCETPDGTGTRALYDGAREVALRNTKKTPADPRQPLVHLHLPWPMLARSERLIGFSSNGRPTEWM